MHHPFFFKAECTDNSLTDDSLIRSEEELQGLNEPKESLCNHQGEGGAYIYKHYIKLNLCVYCITTTSISFHVFAAMYTVMFTLGIYTDLKELRTCQ